MKIFLSIFLCIFLWIDSEGQTITPTVGMWSNNIAANTISTAGNDYNQNVTSNTNYTLLNVTPTSANWVVRVEKTVGSWHNSLELYAIRTGDGFVSSTTATVLGGTTFFMIQNSPLEFFRGTYSRTNIPIQYEIRGLSVLIPAGNYSTTVYYTISDN